MPAHRPLHGAWQSSAATSVSWGPRRHRSGPQTAPDLSFTAPLGAPAPRRCACALHASTDANAERPVARGRVSKIQQRVLAGAALGAVGGSLVTAGGLPYLLLIEFFVYHCSQEFFGMVAQVGLREGKPPPPPWGTALVTLACMSLPLYTYLTAGKIALALAIASFVMCSVFVTTTESPKLASLSSGIFGLLYCGYLPAYWLKLRLIAAPAINSALAPHWPQLLGGLTHVTVGLVATFTSIACIVSADVGAYFVGKNFGRTRLTAISPGKTVEGALGGLAAAVACALALRALSDWPAPPAAAAGLGVLVFGSSLLGDLIESVMKRDAGMKDSGTLIPGHGGVLDRFDSYIFTGAVVYFYVRCLPLAGL